RSRRPQQSGVRAKGGVRPDQPRACANLGAFYATGQLAGIARDIKESMEWSKRATDLGAMALRGEGMPRDPRAAETYFKRADELGFDVDGYLQQIGLQRKP